MRLNSARRRLTATRTPVTPEARALWDQIHGALASLEAGMIEVMQFDATIRAQLSRSAELTMRGEISILDAEQVNRLGAAVRMRAVHYLRAAPST